MPRCAPTELASAFATLKAHIKGFEQPYEPHFEAEAEHLADWAEHLDQVLEATRQYARAVVGHFAHVTNVTIADETGDLADAASQIVGALRTARNRIEQEAA